MSNNRKNQKDTYVGDNWNEKNFVFKTKLSVATYIELVERIVNAYFNSETNEYEPHLGNISTMQLFYEYCVVSSDLDAEMPNGVSGLSEIELVADDPCFMQKYNDEINATTHNALRFGDAYNCAQKIIADRLNSPERLINAIGDSITKGLASLKDMLTSEKMDELAKALSENDLTSKEIADAIVKDLAKANEFKQMVAGSKIGQ
jgi:hypothetical protein